MKTLIVGGVAGGASAAARLRRLDEKAEIVMLERGEYISYANCGLPYYIGGVIENKKAIEGQAPEDFGARFNIDVRTRNEALELNIDAGTVRVKNHDTGEEYTESYDTLLLAPGAEAVRPPFSVIDDARVFTLRTVPDALSIHSFVMEQKPRTAAIVGGGFIGLEMAENLSLQGIKVSIVEKADHLLPPLDADMAFGLHRYLMSKGVGLHLKQSVQALTAAEDGAISVKLQDSAFSVDMVILSVGVRAESTLARAAGLALDERGAVLVDEHMRTSSANVYAVGDVVAVKNALSGAVGQLPLAGPANKQGRIAADNIAGIPTKYKGAQGSAIAKIFDLSVAVTGLNEAAARAVGYTFDKIYTSSLAHAAYYPGAGKINMKVLFERETGRLLGAQVLGFEGVDKRCDVLATAMRAGMTVVELSELDLCYAPPYGAAKDPINMIGYAAENLMAGLVKQYYWEDVKALQANAGVVLLDVRAVHEYAGGHIEGSINIPLNELRGRMGELNASKPVYIVCQSGLRSYIASRLLNQNGLESYSLAGGYQLYQDATTPLQGAE